MVRRWRVRVLASAVTALSLVALTPGVAEAKGASDVTISGPGLPSARQFSCCQSSAREAPPGMLLGNPNELGEATGLTVAVFRVWPTPMVRERPAGPLGPRYRLMFNFLTGVDQVRPIRQDVYPFARAGFVSYTPPGQHALHRKTRSGWYVSAPQPNGGGMTSEAARALLATFGVTGRVAQRTER